MGHKKSREYTKQREGRTQLIHAQTEERTLIEDVCIPGIGLRRLQVVRMPSFTIGYSWDIRQRDEHWRLFRGEISAGACLVRGHTELDADSSTLGSLFDEVCALVLPLRPSLSNMGGLDGTLFQLAVFGDLSSALRIQWWSDYPEHWKSMVEIADRMMEYFDRLRPRKNKAES
jgi:hypothetical protein